MMSVKVRMKDGAEIDADLNSCTACMGRLKVGDEVRVSPPVMGTLSICVDATRRLPRPFRRMFLMS